MEEKVSKKQNFLKGIIAENPLFVSILGTCPALAVTRSLESAIGMGILFTIVLICSNVLISLLRKIIPDEVRTPAYIVVIATFVTIVEMLTHAFLPELYSTLGVYISLIVVNCIVLGRAEAYASKNGPVDSLIDACGMGLGYSLAIMAMGLIRELLGTGLITFGVIFTFIPKFSIPILAYPGSGYDLSIGIFQQPAGAFIVFGVILAILAFVKNRKEENAKAKKKVEMAKLRAKNAAEAAAKAKAVAEAKAKEAAQAATSSATPVADKAEPTVATATEKTTQATTPVAAKVEGGK